MTGCLLSLSCTLLLPLHLLCSHIILVSVGPRVYIHFFSSDAILASHAKLSHWILVLAGFLYSPKGACLPFLSCFDNMLLHV